MSLKKRFKLVFSGKIWTDVMANIIVGAFLRIAYYYFIVKKGKRKKPSIEHISEEFFKLITNGLQSPVMF